MMIARCENPDHVAYKYYGERGIKVYKEWHSFIRFGSWAISNGYREDLTIDRIDNNGNYEPSNCRWITMKEQMNNRSNCNPVIVNGTIKSFRITKRNKKWQYRFERMIEGKRKSFSKCGFDTKEQAIEAAKKSLECGTLIAPNKRTKSS